MTTFQIILTFIAVILALGFVLVVGKFFNVWLRARVANAPVSIPNLVAMWLRGVPNSLIVDNRITAIKADRKSTRLNSSHRT